MDFLCCVILVTILCAYILVLWPSSMDNLHWWGYDYGCVSRQRLKIENFSQFELLIITRVMCLVLVIISHFPPLRQVVFVNLFL